MSPILVILGVAFLFGALAGGKKKPRTEEQCLAFLGDEFYRLTVKLKPFDRVPLITWMRDSGLETTAQCMEQNAANLAPCRELLIASVYLDMQTRTFADLELLEQQARAQGRKAIADCVATIRAARFPQA